MSDILVVIPAYNEETNIEWVVDKLTAEYPQLDYVIINDGSTDRTAKICAARGYRVVNLSQNLGLAGAFQTGMKFAQRQGYAYAVQFDGDGQHRPEYIEQMKEKMEEGYDIVIASRYVTEQKPHSMRMLGSNLIQMAIRMTTGITVKDPTSGMRMF
ncbi:MAG: glycosyltransferase family 2 protein, partial [Hungatella sp.]